MNFEMNLSNTPPSASIEGGTTKESSPSEYPEDLAQKIGNRANQMDTLNEDIRSTIGAIADTVEYSSARENTAGRLAEADALRNALRAELGLVEGLSPAERLQRENLLIETLRRITPKELLVESLRLETDPETKIRIEEHIIHNEGMIKFLETRKQMTEKEIGGQQS